MRLGSEYIVRITNTRGWYKGLWGQRVSVVKDRINMRGVLTEVWIMADDLMNGVKRFVHLDDAEIIKEKFKYYDGRPNGSQECEAKESEGTQTGSCDCENGKGEAEGKGGKEEERPGMVLGVDK